MHFLFKKQIDIDRQTTDRLMSLFNVFCLSYSFDIELRSLITLEEIFLCNKHKKNISDDCLI